ncbi:unnamed protein product [Paramecium pentaurelia]|uniref:Uncharacterized protein n=1 Tax=Paramecium pentaurelia TaxID=43138 RepID=A0A8S1UEB9_9CILI|nr:unnamed protein product [Paramecium pentaurelia]
MFRNIIKPLQRKKKQYNITQEEDQEELYFQNEEESKQNEESIFFEFKRMRISDDLDETKEIGGKIKKNKQQEGDCYFIYQLNHEKILESINSYKSRQESKKQEENQEIENIIYHSEVPQECFHIVQIDEINYVNSLNFSKHIEKKTSKLKIKKNLKQINPFNHISIKDKVISKRL